MRHNRFIYRIFLPGLFLASPLLTGGDRDAWAGYQWTDDLTPSVSESQSPSAVPVIVKEVHLRELRLAVDNVRSLCGLAALSWSANQYAAAQQVVSGQAVSSAQVYALRTAIAQTYLDKTLTSSGVPSSSGSVNSVWMNSDIGPGVQIRKSHIQDMRLALDHLSTTCADPCATTTWQPGGPGAMIYCTSSSCDLYDSASDTMFYICGAGHAAGAACDGTIPSCVLNAPGSWAGVIAPWPHGPGMRAIGDCDGAGGLHPCECWFETLTCGCPAAPSCFDGIQNQGETGVDCGGPCGACVSCFDGVQNQGELGVDCEGPCPTFCDPCSDPNSCDGTELGLTHGIICGCGNPNGSYAETIGPACRQYRCTNGVWVDKGALTACRPDATCA